VGVTRIESNRNRHFGLKIESKSIENRNLEIVTSLHSCRRSLVINEKCPLNTTSQMQRGMPFCSLISRPLAMALLQLLAQWTKSTK